MQHWIAAIALLLIAAAWGTTFNVTKDVLAYVTTSQFLFWRFLVAGFALLPLALYRRQVDRHTLRQGALLGAILFAGYWLQTEGLKTTTPSRSAFLTALSVIATPFIEARLARSGVNRRAMAGAVIALAGTAFLVGGFDLEFTIGDGLTLLCAVAFAAYLILATRSAAGGRALGLTSIQLLVVMLCSAPAGHPLPPGKTFVIAVIAGTAVVTTAVAFLGLMWAQSRVSASEAAIILSFEPVATALTSYFIYDEPLSRSTLAGGVLIVTALVLSQTGETAPAT